ncbi:MAG: HEPN domain-containing protein [Vicinamibacterales bacterium]
MNPSDALAEHRLARARSALQEADLLIAQQHFNGAMNRVYYSAFYAARAVLATRSLDSSRHSGVIALFQEHFVRSGFIAIDTARALPRAFEKRQSSDYGDFSEPSADEVTSLRQQVDVFVRACEDLIHKLRPAG